MKESTKRVARRRMTESTPRLTMKRAEKIAPRGEEDADLFDVIDKMINGFKSVRSSIKKLEDLESRITLLIDERINERVLKDIVDMRTTAYREKTQMENLIRYGDSNVLERVKMIEHYLRRKRAEELGSLAPGESIDKHLENLSR